MGFLAIAIKVYQGNHIQSAIPRLFKKNLGVLSELDPSFDILPNIVQLQMTINNKN
jgi:hypothetical protein